MAGPSIDHPLDSLALEPLHRELGAKMGPFAGYSMPLQYPPGIMAEHRHTRSRAGLFDISHMGQIRLSGPGAASALEKLVPSDLRGLVRHRQRYTVFTNAAGGILDDLMVTNLGDHLLLVVNAAQKRVDLRYLQDNLRDQCQVEFLDRQALIALQGPESAAVLENYVPQAARLSFMTAGYFQFDSVECLISRCGYTGEDGFEISLPCEHAEAVARALLNQPQVQPVGLGARDSLRLEAGLCLYGHDLDTSTTPVEAGLTWLVAKSYLEPEAIKAEFPGAELILDQIRNGTGRVRVGLIPEGRAPVREGVQVFNDNSEAVGTVTSGGFGPSIGRPVAMAYVDQRFSRQGLVLHAMVRNKSCPVRVSAMPFVDHRYHIV